VLVQTQLCASAAFPAPFESAVYDEVQLHVYGQTIVVTSLFLGKGKGVKSYLVCLCLWKLAQD
jgi:hypothetical protein